MTTSPDRPDETSSTAAAYEIAASPVNPVSPASAGRRPRRGRTAMAIVVVAVLAVTAVGAYAVGLASEPVTSSSGAASVTAGGSDASSAALSALLAGKGQAFCDAFMSNLASGLDVTTARLQTSMIDAVKATIDKAVSDGTLSMERAKALKDRLSSMPGPLCAMVPTFGGPGRMGGRGWLKGFGAMGGMIGGSALFDAAAKALGTTPDALKSKIGALNPGDDLCTLAAKHNVACDTVKTSIRNALKSQLDDAVKAGKLSQDREDRVLERIDAWLAAGVLRPKVDSMPGFGRFGPMGPSMMGPDLDGSNESPGG